MARVCDHVYCHASKCIFSNDDLQAPSSSVARNNPASSSGGGCLAHPNLNSNCTEEKKGIKVFLKKITKKASCIATPFTNRSDYSPMLDEAELEQRYNDYPCTCTPADVAAHIREPDEHGASGSGSGSPPYPNMDGAQSQPQTPLSLQHSDPPSVEHPDVDWSHVQIASSPDSPSVSSSYRDYHRGFIADIEYPRPFAWDYPAGVRNMAPFSPAISSAGWSTVDRLPCARRLANPSFLARIDGFFTEDDLRDGIERTLTMTEVQTTPDGGCIRASYTVSTQQLGNADRRASGRSYAGTATIGGAGRFYRA